MAFANEPWAAFSLSEVNEVKAAGGQLEFLTSQVHAKLSELQGSQADEELPELVCVLVNSQKSLGEIGEELEELLVIDEDVVGEGDVHVVAGRFCKWLHKFLTTDMTKLQEKSRQQQQQQQGQQGQQGQQTLPKLNVSSAANSTVKFEVGLNTAPHSMGSAQVLQL